jgi:hypothetical protein
LGPARDKTAQRGKMTTVEAIALANQVRARQPYQPAGARFDKLQMQGDLAKIDLGGKQLLFSWGNLLTKDFARLLAEASDLQHTIDGIPVRLKKIETALGIAHPTEH